MTSNSESSYELDIQSSTLRLTGAAPNKKYATGFFVAPGLVLTCHHVIEDLLSHGQITAQWNQQDFSVEVLSFCNVEDIAILSIDVKNHPCVYLSKNVITPRKDVYSYGYPEEKKDGNALLTVFEGCSDRGRLLTLKEGNVRQGFSGSPLLDIETRQVFGMITEKREHPQTQQPLGGYAVPSNVIISKWFELLENPAATQAILNLRSISELGYFIEGISQNLTSINPWEKLQEERKDILLQADRKTIILNWAREIHYSFVNIEMKDVELVLHNLESSFSGRGDELYKYFISEKTDLKSKIISQFSKKRYSILAPFEDCIYLFLFLSTNELPFLKMVSSELIKQQFIKFSEDFIQNVLCNIYQIKS